VSARCIECNLKISKDEDGSAMPCPCGDGRPIQPSECDHYWVDSNVDGVLFCVICHADKCVAWSFAGAAARKTYPKRYKRAE